MHSVLATIRHPVRRCIDFSQWGCKGILKLRFQRQQRPPRLYYLSWQKSLRHIGFPLILIVLPAFNFDSDFLPNVHQTSFRQGCVQTLHSGLMERTKASPLTWRQRRVNKTCSNICGELRLHGRVTWLENLWDFFWFEFLMTQFLVRFML